MCRSRRRTLTTPAPQTAVRASAKAMPALRYGKLLESVGVTLGPEPAGVGIVYQPSPCARSSRVLRVAAEYQPSVRG